MFRAWPSFETADYDGWVLRFADGYTKRANSVNPHFGSSLPLASKIAHCESAYRERELTTIFRLTPFSQPEDLDEKLAALGYETLDPTLVMTCSLDGVVGGEIGSELIVSSDEWHRVFNGLRKLEAFERLSHRRIVESSDGEHVFAAISADGSPSACGLGVLVDHTIGLFDLFTKAAYREQGFGSSIVRSILQWAQERETRLGFLQVHSLNTPARRLYERLGFEVAYPYWYRIKTRPCS
jgi:N-acetylglutamate synthase